MRSRISLFLWLALLLHASRAILAEPGDENWDAMFGIPGASGGCFALTWTGGKLYVGGDFPQIGGASANYIAQWDGTNWSALGQGVDGFVDTIVTGGTDVYAGGVFNHAGGAPATNVAKWDGTNWSNLGIGLSGGVRRLTIVGSDLYAAGNFAFAGGTAVSNIAKWNGSSWTSVGSGINGNIATMATDGRNLYVGGSAGVAKWDGTNWLALPNPGRIIPTTLRIKDGELFLYGGTGTSEGDTELYIVRWDGTNWQPVASGEFLFRSCFDCFASPKDMVIVGNDFYITGDFDVGVAKWDGTNWSYLGNGLGHYFGELETYALASSGSELFVGGAFRMAGGNPSTNIALWHIPHSLAITQSGNSVELSWPATGSNMILQAKNDLDEANWTSVSQLPTLVNDRCVVTNQISGRRKFYRLRRW
jgi:hypothetical protein